MISNPKIAKGILLLKQIFDDTGLIHEYDQALADETLTLARQQVTLADILPEIKFQQSSPQDLSIVFQHRAPDGKTVDGSLTVKTEHVANVADFGLLYRAIEYRKANYNLG
jgi:hypothetical protein